MSIVILSWQRLYCSSNEIAIRTWRVLPFANCQLLFMPYACTHPRLYNWSWARDKPNGMQQLQLILNYFSRFWTSFLTWWGLAPHSGVARSASSFENHIEIFILFCSLNIRTWWDNLPDCKASAMTTQVPQVSYLEVLEDHHPATTPPPTTRMTKAVSDKDGIGWPRRHSFPPILLQPVGETLILYISINFSKAPLCIHLPIMSGMHSHDGVHFHASHGHSHDLPAADHGHTHEVLDGPGSYMGREMPIIEGRDWSERAFTVGIGGYVFSLCSCCTSLGLH